MRVDLAALRSGLEGRMLRFHAADGQHFYWVKRVSPKGVEVERRRGTELLPLDAFDSLDRIRDLPLPGAHSGATCPVDVYGRMKWSDSFLDPYRHRADKLADAVVTEGSAKALMARLAAGELAPRTDDSEAVRTFLEKASIFPQWADANQIFRASRFFEQHEPDIALSLGLFSLPTCYAAQKGVQVLAKTGYLNGDGVAKRLRETYEFVRTWLQPGALAPGGPAVASILLVRLIHASARKAVAALPEWDKKTLGVPINQEDMAGTVLAFAGVVQSMSQQNCSITKQEGEDYLHAWKVIGHLMGVDDALSPADGEDAVKLADAIKWRHHAPSKEATDLTKSLLDSMGSALWLFGPARRRVPAALMRTYLEADTADLLGVPKVPGVSLLEIATGMIDGAIPGLTPIATVRRNVGSSLLRYWGK